MDSTRVARSSKQNKDFRLREICVSDLKEGDVVAYGPRLLPWTDDRFIDSSEWVRFVNRVDAPYGFDIELVSLLFSSFTMTARFGPFEKVVVLGEEIVDCVVSVAIGAVET